MQGFEAERLQDLGDVLLWYELQLSLLNEEDRRLPQLLLTGPIPERYLDSSLDELRKQFARARELLRHAAMLHMLTTAEALVRLEFDDLSRRPSTKSPAASAGLDGSAARKLG
jgi:hypothetical protein